MIRVWLGRLLLSVCCIMLFIGGSARAQLSPGRVTGTVLDSSGGAIAGAAVKLTSEGTGLERNQTTDDTGVFNFPELPLGAYTLTVTKSGFKVYVQKGITTVLGSVNELHVAMTPGAITTEVDVLGTTPLLQTETDSVGGSFDSQQVTELPIGNSDYTRFAYLVPGSSTNTDYTFTQVAINGSPSRSVTFNIDGSQNMDAYRELPAINQGGNSFTAATRLPLDAIQDMNVVTGGEADAEAGAGAVNVVLKSGTNRLHGTAYEYHRDASLTAHNYFEDLTGSPKAHFIWNEYGGSLGGPIIKDRTFFFVAYDGSRSVLGSATLANAPTPTQIQSAETLLATVGQAPNQLGLNILKLYQPYSGQFVVDAAGGQSPDDFSVKIDHRLGPNDLLAGRYLFGNGRDAFPQGTDTPSGGSQLQAYYGITPIRPQNFAISEVHTFSPKIVNALRLSYSHVSISFAGADSSFNPNSIGLNTGATSANYGLPEIDIGASVFENLGINTSFPRARTSELFGVNDDLVYSKDKHNIQMGFNFGQSKVFGFNNTNFRGLFTFDGTQLGNSFTSNAPTADLVDLLAGLPDPASTDISRGSTRFDVYQNVFGLYATDTYRLTPKLNVVAGVRWDFFGVPQEDKKRFSNFLPSEGLVSVPGNIYSSIYSNFSPRVAVAYSPFTMNGLQTVIRAGYGIYYVQSPLDVLVGETYNLTNSNPGLATNPINGEGIYDAPLVSTPIEPNVPIFSTALTATPPLNLIAVNPKLNPPNVQNWNVNVQQELSAKVVLSIAYVGAKGSHIYNLLDVNQPAADSGYAPGCVSASACEQTARPYYNKYPQFGQIGTITSGGNSSYNALQVTVQTKNYHGLTTLFGYTWAHDIDEASETMDFFGTSGFVPRNSYDLKTNRSDSEFDVPQAITASYIYQVPNLSERRWVGGLANGWQLSGVITWHDSMPVPDLTYDDISGTGELHDVPNCVAPIVTQLKSFTQAYVVSGLAEPARGTFGNCSRNMIPAPWLTQWDFSLGKWFPIHNGLKLQFRADAFNFLNHPNFGIPASTLGAEYITGTADNVDNDSHFGNGAQRQFQLNARLAF